MYKVLWLDDVRDPENNIWWRNFPGYSVKEVYWAKNYNQFTSFIYKYGLPELICFDHDLADEHMEDFREQKYIHGDNYMISSNYDKFTEKTGYDCAKWLINYCIENKLKLPKYISQSANIVGRENILGVLDNYIKRYENGED